MLVKGHPQGERLPCPGVPALPTPRAPRGTGNGQELGSGLKDLASSVLTLSRTNCVALGKLHDLSELPVVPLTLKGCERLRGPHMQSAFTAVPGISTQLMLGPSIAHAKSLQLRPALCDPMDGRPPDSSVHGILQARILEWAAISCSRGASRPGVGLTSLTSPAPGRFLTASTTWEPASQLHFKSWGLGI